jgi:hypothetical protein
MRWRHFSMKRLRLLYTVDDRIPAMPTLRVTTAPAIRNHVRLPSDCRTDCWIFLAVLVIGLTPPAVRAQAPATSSTDTVPWYTTSSIGYTWSW